MRRIPEIEIVRRAYRLWQDGGEPFGKDQEFYYQAKKELEDAAEEEKSADDEYRG
jgi:Protein of unknown function (DUF2934)